MVDKLGVPCARMGSVAANMGTAARLPSTAQMAARANVDPVVPLLPLEEAAAAAAVVLVP